MGRMLTRGLRVAVAAGVLAAGGVGLAATPAEAATAGWSCGTYWYPSSSSIARVCTHATQNYHYKLVYWCDKVSGTGSYAASTGWVMSGTTAKGSCLTGYEATANYTQGDNSSLHF